MSVCRSGESKKNRQRACGSETGPRALGSPFRNSSAVFSSPSAFSFQSAQKFNTSCSSLLRSSMIGQTSSPQPARFRHCALKKAYPAPQITTNDSTYARAPRERAFVRAREHLKIKLLKLCPSPRRPSPRPRRRPSRRPSPWSRRNLRSHSRAYGSRRPSRREGSADRETRPSPKPSPSGLTKRHP